MKPTVLIGSLALGVCTSHAGMPVVAPGLAQRDIAAINNVMSDISSKLQTLDTAVQNFNGDASSLDSPASSLLNTITQGTTTVSGISSLNANDALSLQPQVQTLQGNAQALLTHLVGKKADFQKASMCEKVSKQCTSLSTDSQTLMKAVIAKVPQEAQAMASNLVTDFNNTVQESEAAFSQGNCSNGDVGVLPFPTASRGSSLPNATGSLTTPSFASNSSTPPATVNGAAVGRGVLEMSLLGVVAIFFV